MLTVAALQDRLAPLPPDTPVNLCTSTPEGVSLARTATRADHLDFALGDDGSVTAVWITGTTPSAVPPPELLAVTCICGDELVLDEHDEWPDAHRHH